MNGLCVGCPHSLSSGCQIIYINEIPYCSLELKGKTFASSETKEMPTFPTLTTETITGRNVMNKEETKRKIEVMQAFVEGKKIQLKRKQLNDAWEDFVHEEPVWNWGRYNYRIKPKLKLRPYKDFEEMAKDAYKHGTMLGEDGLFGHFALKTKSDGSFYMDVSLCVFGVLFTKSSIAFADFQEMLKNFTWADGTPCGVEEEV